MSNLAVANPGKEVLPGLPNPLGASFVHGGVNFSVYSRDAIGMELVLFDDADSTPTRIIPFDPSVNRTYHYWHLFLPGLPAGQIYGYRARGPANPEGKMRFDPEKVLLDPYGRGVVVPENYSRDAASRKGENASTAMKSVIVDMSVYDWEGDVPLHRAASQTIVYEMHVGGFTRHASSGVPNGKRGTFAGLIEKIPYLKQLGITAVELLPVFQFDSLDCPPGRVNYWGYAPVSFFSVHRSYSSRQDPAGPEDEFRDMVKALHRAGIEIILDVVYNHTAEGGQTGPTLSFRGLANDAYYLLEGDGSGYANYSGTGNTLNANHPVTRRMIVDSLRYWVQEMHVDGFRFDLASILARDSAGRVLPNPPVLWDIESDPALAGTKMIAEAWDAAGLYQVGSFVGDSWREWNGKFRDDVRAFVRGDERTVKALADGLLGSPDLYSHKRREAEQSIHFVTCHDGFTLNDLVSYNEKHNEANGEDNRDGGNDNRSWNCGVEGPTDDRDTKSLRNRQVKNFFTVTLMAVGLPMILMGDEVRRSQQGNNNSYCHDNETNWLDWTLLAKHADVHRFVSLLNARRATRNLDPDGKSLTLSELLQRAPREWHGTRLHQPDWSDCSHSLALSLELTHQGLVIHWILNAYWESLDFELPHVEGGGEDPWRRWIDTTLDSPEDIVDWEATVGVPGFAYRVGPRSVVLLCADLKKPGAQGGGV